MTIKQRENDRRGIFYIEDKEGVIAELNYRREQDDVIIIDHTEVKRKMENRGIGASLVKEAVEYARKNNLKIEPLCPFAEVQFERNKSYQDVRA